MLQLEDKLVERAGHLDLCDEPVAAVEDHGLRTAGRGKCDPGRPCIELEGVGLGTLGGEDLHIHGEVEQIFEGEIGLDLLDCEVDLLSLRYPEIRDLQGRMTATTDDPVFEEPGEVVSRLLLQGPLEIAGVDLREGMRSEIALESVEEHLVSHDMAEHV